jgi:hypothetical protein
MMPKIDEHETFIRCPKCGKNVGEVRRQSLEELGGNESVTAHQFIPFEKNECEKITNIKCFDKDVLFERTAPK